MQFLRFRWSAPVWVAGLLVSLHLHSLDAIAGDFQGGGRGSKTKSGAPLRGAARIQQGNGGQEPEECVYENWPLSSSAVQLDNCSGDTGTSHDGRPDRSQEQREEPTYMNVLRFRASPTNSTRSKVSSKSTDRSKSDSGTPAVRKDLYDLHGQPQAFPEDFAMGRYAQARSGTVPENSTGTDGGAGRNEFLYEECGPDRYREIGPGSHIPPTYISYLGDAARRETGGGSKGEPVYATIEWRNSTTPSVVRSRPGVLNVYAHTEGLASADANDHGLRHGAEEGHIYEEVANQTVFHGRRRRAGDTVYSEVRRSRGQKPGQPVTHPHMPSRQDTGVSETAPATEEIYEVLPLRRRGRNGLQLGNAVHATGDGKRANMPGSPATRVQMQPITAPAAGTGKELVYDVSLRREDMNPTAGNGEEPFYEGVASFWGDMHRSQSDDDVYATRGNRSGRRAAGSEMQQTDFSAYSVSTQEPDDYETSPLRRGETQTSPLHEEIYGPVGGAGASQSVTGLHLQRGEHNSWPADDQEENIYEELPLFRVGAGAKDAKTNSQSSLLGKVRRAFKLTHARKVEPHSDGTRE